MASVRPATADDAAAIREVHIASIRVLAASRYTDEQIAAWSAIDDPDYPIDDGDRAVFVAETDGEVVGFGQLNAAETEIEAVYVHPDHARNGVGTALLGRLETAAHERGIGELTLSASLNAVPFYEANGYLSVERATHELTDGTELSCMEMRVRGELGEP